MATVETRTVPVPELDETARRRMMRRAIIASATGTTIEWYDFFLYGVAAALVFPRQFFPGNDPYTGTLLAFSTYFVGFIARPFGAALFGHYGDRIGRKTALIATLVLMGGATIGIGLVPNYESIGIWGAVLLTFFRIIQGIGVGGEWGGAVLMAGEWTDPKRRGFTTSFAQLGAPAGHGAGQRRAVVHVVCHERGGFSQLGLARALHAQRGPGVRGPVHPHRRARDARLRQAARRGARRRRRRWCRWSRPTGANWC